MEQNNASKQKRCHCDKTMIQVFFIFIILNIYVFTDNTCHNSAKRSSGSGEEVILLFLLFLVTAAILDIRPDPILQF